MFNKIVVNALFDIETYIAARRPYLALMAVDEPETIWAEWWDNDRHPNVGHYLDEILWGPLPAFDAVDAHTFNAYKFIAESYDLFKGVSVPIVRAMKLLPVVHIRFDSEGMSVDVTNVNDFVSTLQQG